MYQYKDCSDMNSFDSDMQKTWDGIQDNIYIRYINKGSIEEYGSDIVYDTFMDLAVTASVQEVHGDETYSHLITNDDISKWKVDIDKVFKQGYSNMEVDRRKRILPLSEYLLRNNTMYPVVKKPPMPYIVVGDTSNHPGVIYDEDEESGLENVLVVTSQKESFGASYALMPSTLKEVYERFGKQNYYLVPISINAMMCIRYNYITKNGVKDNIHVEDELLDMLYKMNDNSNSDFKDILSYRIYYFSGDDGECLFSIKSR